MTEREKVIKGLEICSAGEWNSTGGRDHTSCPYYPAGYTGCTCKPLMRDAIALLKALEPRIMTESELEGYISSLDGEARVWIEHKKLGLYCASLWSRNPSRGDQNFYDVMHECYFDRSEIGKWWRPWTSRPTDEQREMIEWDA